MSHDKKKKPKTAVDATHVPVEVASTAAKGSSGTVQKGSGDAKSGVKNAVPDSKSDSKKASKSKKR